MGYHADALPVILRFEHPVVNYAMKVKTIVVYVFYWCDMFRLKSRLSSGTTNCTKSKNGINKFGLSELRSQFYNVFIVLRYTYGFI
jgi:hypothetical protein